MITSVAWHHLTAHFDLQTTASYAVQHVEEVGELHATIDGKPPALLVGFTRWFAGS